MSCRQENLAAQCDNKMWVGHKWERVVWWGDGPARLVRKLADRGTIPSWLPVGEVVVVARSDGRGRIVVAVSLGSNG